MEAQMPFSAGFMRFIYVGEALAPFGLILPGLFGVLPWLTPLAAAGLVPIMAGAAVLHLSRKEIPPSFVTGALLALSVLVALARGFVIPL